MLEPNTDNPNESKLNPKQERALAALLEEPTIKKAAAAAGVNEATLWRWLQTPDFRRAYMEFRRKAVQQAMARIQRFTTDAASVLHAIMQDESKPPYTRVAAANSIIASAARAVELDDQDERLAQIERDLDSIKPKE
jgi:DNA-binding MurR/RpiR family transcriptional regulator